MTCTAPDAGLKARGRHRLVGASILFAALFVTLPWVLDREPPASRAPLKGAEPARRIEPLRPASDAVYLQLGIFARPENAHDVQATLTKNAIPSFTETFATAAGQRVRVRAGPFASREEAEQARERLKRLGIDAVMMARKS